MNIVALQIDIAWEDKAANFLKVRRLLAEVAPEKDSLVVLPEMFATGFTMNTATMAESYRGETEQFLAGIAREFGVCVVAGAAMRGRDGRARNKALVCSPPGELLAFYAKMRPFTLGGEAECYAAGERPVVFKWGDWTISPFICYDLRFPEIFREATVAHQPHLFVSSPTGSRGAFIIGCACCRPAPSKIRLTLLASTVSDATRSLFTTDVP